MCLFSVGLSVIQLYKTLLLHYLAVLVLLQKSPLIFHLLSIKCEI